MRSRSIPWALGPVLALGLAVSAPAGSLDWAPWAALDTVDVITSDEDGEVREHPIWIAVSDGTAYVRTSQRTAWGDNLERNGTLRLRGAPGELSLRAEKVTETAEIERVTAAFDAKYGGFMGWMADWIRGTPRIFRLSAE